MHRVRLSVFAAVALLSSAAAEASFVSGDTIDLQAYGDTTGTTETPYGSPLAYVYSPGGTGSPEAFTMFNGTGGPVTATVTSLAGGQINVSFSGSWTAPACAPSYNCLEGLAFTVPTQTVTGASLVSYSGIAPSLPASAVGTYAGTGFVNLEGTSGAAGSNFTFAVTAVPLPATLPMLLSGMGAIGLLARRRKLALT